MTQSGADQSTERERLIFGAGFAFGVLFTMLILAVVVAAVVPDLTVERALQEAVLLSVGSAVLLAAVVGFGLYFLALPDRGPNFSAEPLLDDETEIETE